MPPALAATQEIAAAGIDVPAADAAQPARGVPVARRQAGRTLAFALAWVVPLLMLAIWQTGSRHGWISSQTLPAPRIVLDTFLRLSVSGELKANIGVSMVRVLSGFAIGAGFGLVLGVAMGLSKAVKEYLYPTFKILAYVPLLGWLPLLIMVFGIGETLKFVLIAKASFIPITLNTYQGIRNVPAIYIEMGKVYRFTRLQLLRRIVFPAAFPSIWSGIRYGLTNSWLILVVVEMLASSEGLGYMMASGQQLFQLDLVLVAVAVVGLIGFFLDKLLEYAERHLLRWRRQVF